MAAAEDAVAEPIEQLAVKSRPSPLASRSPSRVGGPPPQQLSQSNPNLVYFSYFEEPPSHQLEQEERSVDHNHFLNEAKALKHAADKQVHYLIESCFFHHQHFLILQI